MNNKIDFSSMALQIRSIIRSEKASELLLENTAPFDATRILIQQLEKENAELHAKLLAAQGSTSPSAPQKINWSKMPKDTLVEVRNQDGYPWKKRYFYNVDESKYICYGDGGTSESTTYRTKWNQIRLIENKPQPWFGEACSLPEGVKVKVWRRNFQAHGYGSAPQVTGWEWDGGLHDIIAIQILGPMEGWE